MQRLCRRTFAVCFMTVIGVVTAGLPSGTTATSEIFHHPRIPASRPANVAAGWASSNWSGYAATGTTYSSVTAKWIVPAVTASRKATYSSDWVGIDGFNNSDLIQTGTESDYYNGSAHYAAWWEILPASETVIPSITVKPGDVSRHP